MTVFVVSSWFSSGTGHLYPYFVLQSAIAKAWKVIKDEPIIVRLHMSVSRYLDAGGEQSLFKGKFSKWHRLWENFQAMTNFRPR